MKDDAGSLTTQVLGRRDARGVRGNARDAGARILRRGGAFQAGGLPCG